MTALSENNELLNEFFLYLISEHGLAYVLEHMRLAVDARAETAVQQHPNVMEHWQAIMGCLMVASEVARKQLKSRRHEDEEADPICSHMFYRNVCAICPKEADESPAESTSGLSPDRLKQLQLPTVWPTPGVQQTVAHGDFWWCQCPLCD